SCKKSGKRVVGEKTICLVKQLWLVHLVKQPRLLIEKIFLSTTEPNRAALPRKKTRPCSLQRLDGYKRCLKAANQFSRAADSPKESQLGYCDNQRSPSDEAYQSQANQDVHLSNVPNHQAKVSSIFGNCGFENCMFHFG
uniref:Ovule protein n=1 Tax=Macrostomum lignano TaxID=282301 RepID=A0A1I8HS56_9PLAT